MDRDTWCAVHKSYWGDGPWCNRFSIGGIPTDPCMLDHSDDASLFDWDHFAEVMDIAVNADEFGVPIPVADQKMGDHLNDLCRSFDVDSRWHTVKHWPDCQLDMLTGPVNCLLFSSAYGHHAFAIYTDADATVHAYAQALGMAQTIIEDAKLVDA